MTIDVQPEIAGPDASVIQPTDSAEPIKPQIDPAFPFGRPEEIDWTQLDTSGIVLINELNLRPWIKSTEYCSGHPLNRHPEEISELYPYVTGEDVYEETSKLDRAYLRGLIPDVYFRSRKRDLRENGITRFYLNINVYNLTIFHDWIKVFSSIVMVASGSSSNPLIVRYNPLRVGINYTLYWDYWTTEERDLIHNIAIQSLNNFPV